MRIAMANNYYYLRGGCERVFIEEKRLLEAEGHQVSVFSQAHPSNEFSEHAGHFRPFKDWRNTSLIRRIPMGVNIIYDRRVGRDFRGFLQEDEPDIVHAHNIYGGLTTSILDVAQRKGVPVVMTLHDYKLICPSYAMLDKGRICEDCRGRRFVFCVLNRCHKDSLAASSIYCAESYLNRWLGKYDSIRCLICPSLFSLRKHSENGIPEDKLVYIPNFVDSAGAQCRCEGGDYVLFVGRLSREKGILTLLKAARQLNALIRIVGDGPLRAEYEQFAGENGLSNVVFEGYKSGEDLKNLYENASFLVIPSEWYENAPMTILEAYSYGKPVIGSRIGGIPEMVEHGLTGLLFTPGNVGELADSIRTLWSDQSMITKMGRAARSKAEKDYSSEVHCKQLMRLYQTLLS